MRFKKPRFLNSLAVSLLGIYVCTLALIIALVGAVGAAMFHWRSDALVRHAVSDMTDMLLTSLQFDMTGRPVALALSQSAQWIFDSLSEEVKYRIVDASGQVLLSSERGGIALAPLKQAFTPSRRSFDFEDEHHLFNAITAPVPGAEGRFYLQVASSYRLIDLVSLGVTSPLILSSLLTAVTAIFVFAIVILLATLRVLKPLREASFAASQIQPWHLDVRVSSERLPTEIQPLISAFNSALARLEQGYRVQKAFLASVAHELKTPLALIRAQIEMENFEERSMLLRDLDFMSRQVHQLLQLAEVSEVQSYIFEPIDVAAIAMEVVTHLGRLAERAEVQLALKVSDEAANVQADGSALFILLRNLVENAIQHSHMDAIVSIRVSREGISVMNYGNEIPAELLPNLFVRFWRGPTPDRREAEGAGLGLAICQEIAQAHGWQIKPDNVTGGVEFNLVF